MNKQISNERISKLNVDNIKVGDTIIFCNRCDYQDIGVARKPVCPKCNNELYLIDITDAILDEIKDIKDKS
jgi:anaerobic ribonucleoside-triphosphate reductase